MGKYVISFVVGALLALAILNPFDLYAQVSGQPVETPEWLWWLAPLAVLAVGFIVIRYLLKNVPQESPDDYLASFGAKGGEVERRHTQNDVYVDNLKDQERKLRNVYESKDDEIDVT